MLSASLRKGHIMRRSQAHQSSNFHFCISTEEIDCTLFHSSKICRIVARCDPGCIALRSADSADIVGHDSGG